MKSMLPELIAEFFGTLVLILFGDGVVAMVVLFGSGAPGEVVHGGFTNITLGWGLGVTMGIYIAGRISGAHINPAVTIALAIYRDFPWRKVGPYIVAQVLGAFLAAALVFWNYSPAFLATDPQLDHTAGVFTTFLAIIDERNQPPGANLTPVLIGAVVVAVGISFGGMHGYAINPARDFGPRLFTAVAGFKNNGLTDGSGVFWVPIAGPILGGLIGAAAYDYGVRRFLPEVKRAA